MQNQPQNNKYGFDVLQRYHAGTLPAAERHAIEKAALDDPFLADALEGYTFTKTAAADVEALQKRLNAKIKKWDNRGAIFNLSSNRWLRIAAAFIVLLGAGWGSYQLLTGKKETIAVTQATTEIIDTENQIPATDSSSFLNTTPDFNNSETTTATTTKRPPTAARKLSKKIATKPLQNQTAAANVTEAATQKLEENNSIADKTLARVTSPTITDGIKKDSTLFQGKVVDVKGNAVPFATIASQDKQLITATDLNGSFSLPAADSTLKVTASAVGYQSLSLQLSAPAPNLFILPESDAALNEIVVTAFAKKSEKASRKSILESGSLEPAEGWQHFEDYVAQNLKQTEVEKSETVKGTVTLAFEVSETGEPFNIKVVNSQCTQCDAEAIRLLKSGPKWKKGKSGRVKIRF